jgi:hypothetical protein
MTGMRSLLALLAALALAAGCGDEFEEQEGSGGAGPCQEDPWSCPDMQTCWPTSDSSFGCLNQGQGAVGAPCNLGVGSSPTCLADLFCYATALQPGVCSPFCDPADPDRACPGNAPCDDLFLNQPLGLFIRVCRP